MHSTDETAWLTSLKHNANRVLGMMMLISWATVLTTYTILLQNSCTPLLEWTNTSARDCPQKIANSSVEHFNKSSVIGQQKTEKSSSSVNSKKNQETSSPKVSKSDKKQEASSKVSSSVSSKHTDSKDKRNGGNTSKEVIGAAAGSVAAIGLAVIGAPVVVIAGVGFAVWLAARTLFSLGK